LAGGIKVVNQKVEIDRGCCRSTLCLRLFIRGRAQWFLFDPPGALRGILWQLALEPPPGRQHELPAHARLGQAVGNNSAADAY